MKGKCSLEHCTAPLACYEGDENFEGCGNWKKNNPDPLDEESQGVKTQQKSIFNWGGEALKVEELPLVSARGACVNIGIFGKADAGKTTFLAMLYTLLYNGHKFDSYDFVGSKTILGWDYLYTKLKILKEKVSFPAPTPSEHLRCFHLALRNNKGKLKDILLSDASGEVFSTWANNREDENAKNAQWIYANSDAFILFIDCEDLIENEYSAKIEILDIANQLLSDLRNRPIVCVWSKSDKKQQVPKEIIESLMEELDHLFSNYTEIEISNFMLKDPDELVHENNLKVIDWILEQTAIPESKNWAISTPKSNDLFFRNGSKINDDS